MKYHEIIAVFYSLFPTYNVFNFSTLEKPIKSSRKNKAAILGHGKNDGKEYFQKETGFHKSILQFSNKSGHGYSFHPTQKPVALMEYLIKTYTNPLETVLDFTMGSGSTGVAAVNTGRKFIGIEMDDKYFEMAEQRINENNLL